MKPITEYKDYRKYMQDFYDERKRTGAFSWREFSKRAGFSSPTYLKLVCEGKSGLSKVKMKQVSRAMDLTGYEEEYFSLLVVFAKATKDADKKAALLEMERIALEHRVRVIDSETFQYYESWKYPVIRELAPMMPGAQPRDIAEECKEYVSAEEVRDILSFLVKAGFLKKDGDKVYSQTEKAVIGSPEALPIAIRSMHKEMGNMAVRAVDRYKASERYFTGMTIGVNESNYARIIAEIEACAKRIAAIANESENLNQVYGLNFQLFPFTNKIEGEEHD
ncbi:TIGR02147 family protein [Fibrobacter sp.]|uniref:TIGR02147 family protein n=1 Tax=Fibrobacter sp. TaxID=35828 RepID=UPI00387055C0